ncbi:methyl-accepting chemotaxis protein [Acetobacter orientalis]|uniref:Methyl-accepting chemotaxis protein n=1 Tax=Acetobacter orientalis TaxID=146474 RepID=A0A2Z5ZHI2_9PROT|nr:methyl-accepting chemotaxis protein [Acetobacter orientalis]
MHCAIQEAYTLPDLQQNERGSVRFKCISRNFRGGLALKARHLYSTALIFNKSFTINQIIAGTKH